MGVDPYPAGAAKLVDTAFWHPQITDLRVGDLRVIYVVDEAAGVVAVVKVARRSESTYRARRLR